MAKKLILVRHGQSEWNKLNLFTGWKDVDLSEQGKQEAAHAGKAMWEYNVIPKKILCCRCLINIPTFAYSSIYIQHI